MTPYLITIAIIIITVITSLRAFNDRMLHQRMLFNPYLTKKDKDYVRFITSGLIHADYLHLGLNMYVLYLFGQWVEPTFNYLFGPLGSLAYVVMYFVGIVVSHSISFFKHKDNPYYNSLGASGAVSAVVFSAIVMYPIDLQIWRIPGVIFGILYLGYSHYMSDKNTDRIGHDAHFAGAIFGILFTLAIRPKFAIEFVQKITSAW